MGADVYAVKYRKPDGSVIKSFALGEDARQVARTMSAVGKAMGWEPLLNDFHVHGTPLPDLKGLNFSGHRSTAKQQRDFACAFADENGQLEELPVEAYDKESAKKAARALARSLGRRAVLDSLRALPPRPPRSY